MNHVINAKGTTVTNSIKEYIEKKYSKFEKYINEDADVYTKIEVKEGGKRHKVEITIPIGKHVIRAEVNSDDMYAAIDQAEDVMARRLRKRKEKLHDRKKNVVDKRELNITDATEIEDLAKDQFEIAKVKTFTVDIMTAQEACEAMELVGHDFFIYIDKVVGAACAVYKRHDGTYGQLICVPDEK